MIFQLFLLSTWHTLSMYACMARIYVHCISENLRSSFLCAFVHAKRTFESVCTYKQPVVVVILCGSLSLTQAIPCCMLMKSKFRQIHKILQGKRRIETRNIVDSGAKTEKKRERQNERSSTLCSSSLLIRHK